MDCDLLVVGGGINGTGIARDAAGRGLSVVLCEQDDLAGHTSSASTKLIHGGLRYLEQFEFSLVRKALRERERLLRAAPHLIRPLRFVLPHDRHQRPAWMIQAGLFLYDHLARRELLPGSRRIALQAHPAGAPLKAGFADGFVYSDGWVDDARLVVANAIDAAERGATILTRTRCVSAVQRSDGWLATLAGADGATITVRARCLVNAAGPWAGQFHQKALPSQPGRPMRLVKGSHIIVRKLFEHPFAYIFQNADGRIVFAIPYESDFTLVGTTDIDFQGDPGKAAIDSAEIAYLCELCNHYFRKPVAPADIVWTYSGVRPLLDDGTGPAAALTRDYQLVLEDGDAPLLSVFGGKITTYRKLAEEALDRLAPLLQPPRGAWTEHALLPGADLAPGQSAGTTSFDDFIQRQLAQYPWLPPALVLRYAHAYGSRMDHLLHDCSSLSDLGLEILPGLYEIEARQWMQREWALTADDMLWRRSKLGLHVPADGPAILAAWIARQPQPADARLAP
ncbi:glycerol-3-phosphate dehydrogenase [Janthinobacterium sp. 17J80-10]|uniref:glycerol-3-phosphate dehydrogenase n=1 Tax=Janthinobacterium sp. 17J80-10 TaxID=2497863 RepID=UPI0010052B18|nr:glycerol-3-phosphate dehydrogenase [Janthinobacterium sp. 17J80-10]QAU32868.1 glycerol-3-phosphate dehydrogenase [Janthinobacterium sp. 17J80-10]